jgi:signal transduction histidine kinase/DNA-binding response OmpR family regulator
VSEALRWLPDGFDGVDEPLPPSPAIAEAMRQRVLLADDNADMRDYLSHLLATTYEVTAVADGKEALAAATRVRPDLILTDVMMPHVDGFGLLQRLRAEPTLREIPVIVLSARAGEEAKVEGLRMGADDYLVKPFSARELLARVAANIELSRTRAQSAQVLRDEAYRLEVLNRTATALAAEIEVEPLVQLVTDAAAELTGAQSGAFVYNVVSSNGEMKSQYTLSSDSRENFAGFLEQLTVGGEGVVRSGDIRDDHVPAGNVPVVSYLSVPVIAPNGDLLGSLVFAHTEPNMFTEHHELIVTGIASQAAMVFEKARLYEASRNAEAALRQLNETLEQRVAAEVAERMKAEQALRQAQKMEAIGHLTGGVAHDFNNLLQVVLGSLEALKRRIDSPAMPSPNIIVRSVDIAMRGAERAASLTQRLLAFSRQQPLDPRPTDVNRLITGMSELLRRTLGESVAIDIVLGGGLWWISVDPNQLENAILNLAVNARDAMPDGGRLTIESGNAALDEDYAREHQEVQSGQYVMLAISDTGTGMTKDVVASAFDPFFTTKEPGQGTGLGLSQVYGFVKQSNGHVIISSEPGEGTSIRIYFPRLIDETRMEEKAIDVAYPVGNRIEVVLLVEDNEAVRQTNAAMLDELGYAVIEAENAAEALKIIETAPNIRLLFTDVGLPDGVNGRQLADLALQRRPSLKILFTTGYARNAIVHGGRLDPGIQLIAKPFTVAALAIKLRELLDEA